MSRALLTTVTFAVVFASALLGALGVASLAIGHPLLTLTLLGACVATAWTAFHLPRPRR